MTKTLKALSPLRRRMIDDMSLRNLSPATQRSYIHAVAKFSKKLCDSQYRKAGFHANTGLHAIGRANVISC